MSDPVSNDELDWLIWRLLQLSDKHPAIVRCLIADAGGQSHGWSAQSGRSARMAATARWSMR